MLIPYHVTLFPSLGVPQAYICTLINDNPVCLGHGGRLLLTAACIVLRVFHVFLRPVVFVCPVDYLVSWWPVEKLGCTLYTRYIVCSGTYAGIIYYITERSVWWYYGFSIASTSAASVSARRPRRREHSNSKNIQHISFKFYMRVNTPLRYFAIEIWYPPMTRTTAFTAKRHSYPPNLQNAISP